MITGIFLFLIFLIFAILMYSNKLPALLSLPLMAVSLSIAGGVSAKDILNIVIAEGAVRLHIAYTTVFFGSMLASLVSKTGIAEQIIKKTAEFAGDKPFIIALILTFVNALLFTTLGGLGAVIMVGTIIFPILLSSGISPLVSACLFLIGLSLGGTFNLTNWQFYIDFLKLTQGEIMDFAIVFGSFFAIITVIFLAIEIRKKEVVFWKIENNKKLKNISNFALITPVIPLLIVIFSKVFFKFEFPIIPAMIIGLLYGAISTYRRETGIVQILSRCIIEGIQEVGPAVGIMMGIGMVLKAVQHPDVGKHLTPILAKVMPSSPLTYVLFFSILAPLALYRGPLNIWGMGSGLIGIMLQVKTLSPLAIMGALMSVGMIQGVCDPTNTHNVWVANYLGVDVNKILRKTIIYIWILALSGLLFSAIKYF